MNGKGISSFLFQLVQQNHDGLPQKAGFPQAALNEIHGSWYDPSNPVVMMDGQLRDDLFADLLHWEQRADLVLALGTSMCGMNADRVFTTVAEKTKRKIEAGGRPGGGGVIVGLQRTQHDSLACLRIYAPADDVMKLLAEELGFATTLRDCAFRRGGEWSLPMRVPYDQYGHRTDGSETTLLDLREGARVRISAGPYAGDEGEVIGTNLEGHIRIVFNHKLHPKKPLRRPFERVLGLWWIEAAEAGSVVQMAIVNVT